MHNWSGNTKLDPFICIRHNGLAHKRYVILILIFSAYRARVIIGKLFTPGIMISAVVSEVVAFMQVDIQSPMSV